MQWEQQACSPQAEQFSPRAGQQLISRQEGGTHRGVGSWHASTMQQRWYAAASATWCSNPKGDVLSASLLAVGNLGEPASEPAGCLGQAPRARPACLHPWPHLLQGGQLVDHARSQTQMVQLGSIAAEVRSARSRAVACLAIEVGLRVHACALQRHWVRLSCTAICCALAKKDRQAMQRCSGAVRSTTLARLQTPPAAKAPKPQQWYEGTAGHARPPRAAMALGRYNAPCPSPEHSRHAETQTVEPSLAASPAWWKPHRPGCSLMHPCRWQLPHSVAAQTLQNRESSS